MPPVTGGGGAGTGMPSAAAWGAVAGGEGAGGAPGARGAGGASSTGAIGRIKAGLSHGILPYASFMIFRFVRMLEKNGKV